MEMKDESIVFRRERRLVDGNGRSRRSGICRLSEVEKRGRRGYRGRTADDGSVLVSDDTWTAESRYRWKYTLTSGEFSLSRWKEGLDEDLPFSRSFCTLALIDDVDLESDSPISL